jgi:MFS family permease
VLVAAAGVLVLSLTAVPAAVITGAAVFGLGFGVTQNVTQTVMYDRVPESAYGASSALWNLAYDGGMGLGAAGFGVLACTPDTRSRSSWSRRSWPPPSCRPCSPP